MTCRLRAPLRQSLVRSFMVSLFVAASVSDATAATEITLWTMRTVEAQMGNLRADVTAFEQQNPGIKVTIEAVPYNVVYPKLAAAIQAGTQPLQRHRSHGRLHAREANVGASRRRHRRARDQGRSPDR